MRAGAAAVAVCVVVALTGCSVGGDQTATTTGDSTAGAATTESASARAYEAAVAAWPRAVWIGDSYTAGAGATSTAEGEAYQASADLHWHAWLDAEGSTGFVNDGHTESSSYQAVPARLAHDAAEVPDPDVVVVDAGRNDADFPWPRVRRAVTSYLGKLAKTWPSAAVVVIAPFVMRSKPDDYGRLRHLLARQARSRGWAFVDPIAEGWIGKSSAGLVAPDGIHPDQEGYDYIVAHLVPAIEDALAAAHEHVR